MSVSSTGRLRVRALYDTSEEKKRKKERKKKIP
jgi:hypothetical protein